MSYTSVSRTSLRNKDFQSAGQSVPLEFRTPTLLVRRHIPSRSVRRRLRVSYACFSAGSRASAEVMVLKAPFCSFRLDLSSVESVVYQSIRTVVAAKTKHSLEFLLAGRHCFHYAQFGPERANKRLGCTRADRHLAIESSTLAYLRILSSSAA